MNNQLANIRILQGKIYLATDNIEEAINAYNNAKSSLVGNDKSTIEIKGNLDLHFSKIAQMNKERQEVINYLNSGIDNYVTSERYRKAINLLFYLIEYIISNGLSADVSNLLDEIENINKRKINNKKNRQIISAELHSLRAKILKTTNLKEAEAELKKANRLFDKLKYFNKKILTLIELSQIERNKSLEKAELLIANAIELARNENCDFELGLALLNLSMIKRMMNNKAELEGIESEAFTFLAAPADKQTAAENFIELARIILLTSPDRNDFDIAINCTNVANSLLGELQLSYGKAIPIFIQALIKIAEGNVEEGKSTITLTTIKAKRQRKNEDVNILNTNIQNVFELLLDDVDGENFNEKIKSFASKLSELENASLYQLIGIAKVSENIHKGRELLVIALNLYDRFVSESPDYQVFLDVIKERIQKLVG